MKTIYVYENWLSEKPSLLGKLYVETVRGGESYAFEYAIFFSHPFPKVNVTDTVCRFI